MSKTIMSKFSAQFKEIAQLTNSTPLALNHSEPKYRSYAENTKGVESDHIKIFSLENCDSFAFAFYYQNIEKPYIVASFEKRNKEGRVYAQYSVESFKQKTKEFLTLFRVLKATHKNLSSSLIEKSFMELYVKEKVKENKSDFDVFERKIAKEVDNIIKSQSGVVSSLHKAQSQKKTLRHKVDKSVLQYKKSIGILDLEKEVIEKQTQLKKLKVDVANYEMKQLSLEQWDETCAHLNSYENKLNYIIKKACEMIAKESSEFPKTKQKQIVDKYYHLLKTKLE